MSALDGRRRAHQDAWAATDVVSSSSADFRRPPLSVSPSGGGALASPPGSRPFSRPVPSLFPRAAFPQEDESVARAKSPTTAVAAGNLLSLILSAAPSRSSERLDGQQGEWNARASVDADSALAPRREDDDDASGSTSDEQPVAVPQREPSKKRPADAIAGQRAGEKAVDEPAAPAPTSKRRYKKPTYIVRRVSRRTFGTCCPKRSPS